MADQSLRKSRTRANFFPSEKVTRRGRLPRSKRLAYARSGEKRTAKKHDLHLSLTTVPSYVGCVRAALRSCFLPTAGFGGLLDLGSKTPRRTARAVFLLPAPSVDSGGGGRTVFNSSGGPPPPTQKKPLPPVRTSMSSLGGGKVGPPDGLFWFRSSKRAPLWR